MNVEDMILVSVDDHVVEPPDMFDGHLPAKYKDARAQGHPDRRRQRRLDLRGQRAPEHRAQRGRRPAARGVRHRADVLRRDAPGLLRHRPAHRRHERQRRARLDVLPVLPAVLRPALQPHRGQGRRPGDGAGLQRLAHRRVVRHAPGPLHPAVDPADLGSRADGRRGPPRGEEGLPRRHVLGEPREARLAELPQRRTGTRSGRRCSDEGTVVCLHIGSSSQLTITSVEAPINVMITLQPMNIVQAAADLLWSRVMTEFPDVRFALSEGGIGWIPYFLERVDYVYEHHQAWTGQDLGDDRRASCSASTSSPASSTTPPASSSRDERRHRPHHLGVRLPALRLDVARLARAAAPSRSTACPTTRSTPSPTRTRCGSSTTTRSA